MTAPRSRWWCFEPTAIDYELLDPGVREVVRWLVAQGFHTTDSGDGEFKRAHGWTEEGGLIPYPHVCMQVEPQDMAFASGYLVEKLRTIGVEVVSQTEAWMEVAAAPELGAKPKPYIEVSYDPVEGVAVMTLWQVTSEMVTQL